MCSCVGETDPPVKHPPPYLHVCTRMHTPHEPQQVQCKVSEEYAKEVLKKEADEGKGGGDAKAASSASSAASAKQG